MVSDDHQLVRSYWHASKWRTRSRSIRCWKSGREELIETCWIASSTGVCRRACTRPRVNTCRCTRVGSCSQESPLSGWLRLALVHFPAILLSLLASSVDSGASDGIKWVRITDCMNQFGEYDKCLTHVRFLVYESVLRMEIDRFR